MDEYRMIDGKDVVVFLSGFATFIKQVVLYLLFSIRYRFILFITTFIVILGVGVLRWYHQPVYYESEMACSFDGETKKFYGDMLQRLDVLATTHSYQTLGRLLSIPDDQAERIINITGKNMAGSLLYEDITRAAENEPFYIDAKVSDTGVLSALQPALIHYLNYNSPSLALARKGDLQDIQTRVDSVNGNIAAIDTAVQAQNKIKMNAADISRFVAMVRYRDSLQLLVLELNRHARVLQSSVSVLHGFMPSQYPADERNKNLGLAAVAAMLIACMVTMLSAMDHETKQARKKTMAVV
jgi:hypothetical protein